MSAVYLWLTVSVCVCMHMYSFAESELTLICRWWWCCFWFLFLPRFGFLLFHSHPMTWVFLCRLAPHASVYFRHTCTHTLWHTRSGTQLHTLTHNLLGGNGNQKNRVFLYSSANEMKLQLFFGPFSPISDQICRCVLFSSWCCSVLADGYVHMRISCCSRKVIPSHGIVKNREMPFVFLLMLFCLRFQANICMPVCIKWNDEEQKILFMGQKHLHVLQTEYWKDRLPSFFFFIYLHTICFVSFCCNTTEQLKPTYLIRNCRNNGRIIQIFGIVFRTITMFVYNRIADVVLNFSSNMKIKLKPDQ